VLSFCVAIFTAYLLLSCCRVAVNAFRDIAAYAVLKLHCVFIEFAYVLKRYASM
jgi:hypothetical protein